MRTRRDQNIRVSGNQRILINCSCPIHRALSTRVALSWRQEVRQGDGETGRQGKKGSWEVLKLGRWEVLKLGKEERNVK